MARAPSRPSDREPPGEYPRRRGREHEVHDEINERRLGGGADPTSEAFQRALEQWQRLPGSVVRPPSDVKAPESPTPNDSGESGPPGPDRDENKP